MWTAAVITVDLEYSDTYRLHLFRFSVLLKWAEELVWQWQGLTHATTEVVGMMDDVDEPICSGSDDDFDDYDDGQDSDDNSQQDDDEQR